jgi:hypothetical protein
MGLRYILIAYHYDEATETTGLSVHGAEARELGERLGLGEPSDSTGAAIWYAEGPSGDV